MTQVKYYDGIYDSFSKSVALIKKKIEYLDGLNECYSIKSTFILNKFVLETVNLKKGFQLMMQSICF